MIPYVRVFMDCFREEPAVLGEGSPGKHGASLCISAGLDSGIT